MATDISVPDITGGPLAISTRRRRLGRVAVAVWAVALVAFCLVDGFPFDRANQSLWIVSGLLAAGVSRPWRRVARIFLDWVPFIAILYLYDYSRGAADLLGANIQIEGPIMWDRALFRGVDPTVWLQQTFYDPQQVHWWDIVGAFVYCSHFLVAWVIAAVLYQRDRDHWFRWARVVVVLSFAALVTYALMPAAPPWYAAKEGLLPHLSRISTRGLDALGLHGAQALFDQGRAVTNEVAAIPSLHTGFAVLVCLWFFNQVPAGHRWWLRPLLVLYPIAMLATLVYSGEHYVVDGLIGAGYVVCVMAGLALWDRRRARGSLVEPGFDEVEPDGLEPGEVEPVDPRVTGSDSSQPSAPAGSRTGRS